jgi:hypothetical protein
MKKRRKTATYWTAPEVQKWIRLEADSAHELDLFDRGMRRRASIFRRRHLNPDDADAKAFANVDRRVVAGGRPFSVVGYLNYSNEEAAQALGLRAREKPGEWEGPRATFDLMIGMQGSWTGPPSDAPCGVCRGADLRGTVDGEVVTAIVCLWCGRSNLDHTIGPVRRKPEDVKAEAEKKKGPETRKERRARHRAVAAGGTGQEEGGPR